MIQRRTRNRKRAPLRAGSGYNPTDAVFTAGMSMRPGDVFATAPLVQGAMDGTGVPDVLSTVRGGLIAGNWYGQFDPYQGGGFCNFLPEQSSGTRTGLAYLWYVSSDYCMAYDYTNGRYSLTVGGQTMTVAQAIVAGTVEYLAWGFDSNNDLDGTNYAYVSRNDAQTFGVTTQPTVSAPDATIYVGSNGSASPVNALVGGLLFVREIPWTGTYGTDTGAGDVVAAHAAGNDVAESIGAWGSTFSLPGNATPGALTPGEGNAWSMRHSSNLLSNWYLDGNTDWNNEGTPTAVVDLADAEKVFPWGVKVTSDAANEGIYQDLTVTAGDPLVIRVLAHSDGTSVPRVLLYDVTNSAVYKYLDGTNTSTRTAPDVLLFTGQVPAGCTTLRVKLINTAASGVTYWHQCELYDNLVTNPSMETGAGNPFIPTTWANLGLLAGEGVQSAASHSGTSALQLIVAGGARGVVSNTWVTTAGDFVGIGYWQATVAIGATHDGVGMAEQASNAEPYTQPPIGGYALFPSVVRATRANMYFRMRQRDFVPTDGTIDDVYAIALDPVSLTVTPASEANSAESGGLRVDGYDTSIQPMNNVLKARSGLLAWRWRPRHSPANLVAFSDGGDPILVQAWGDATNYLVARATAANTIRLEFDAGGGGPWTVDWDCTAAWVADDELYFELEYRGHYMQLRFNGAPVATLSTAVNFTTVPTVVYWGSAFTGGQQIDAVYKIV